MTNTPDFMEPNHETRKLEREPSVCTPKHTVPSSFISHSPLCQIHTNDDRDWRLPLKMQPL